MAVELTLKLTIENGGVGQPVAGGLPITVPKLTVANMREREFFVEHKGVDSVVLDEYFLTRFPEDDSFFVIECVEARDVVNV